MTVKVKVSLQLTVRQSLCQGIEPILGLSFFQTIYKIKLISHRKHIMSRRQHIRKNVNYLLKFSTV
jgi:hypothetical protein